MLNVVEQHTRETLPVPEFRTALCDADAVVATIEALVAHRRAHCICTRTTDRTSRLGPSGSGVVWRRWEQSPSSPARRGRRRGLSVQRLDARRAGERRGVSHPWPRPRSPSRSGRSSTTPTFHSALGGLPLPSTPRSGPPQRPIAPGRNCAVHLLGSESRPGGRSRARATTPTPA